jgi:hypothetical protein
MSWLAANRLASQEGLCCMEWVSKQGSKRSAYCYDVFLCTPTSLQTMTCHRHKLTCDHNSVMHMCWYIQQFTGTTNKENNNKFLGDKSLSLSAYLTHKLKLLHHMTCSTFPTALLLLPSQHCSCYTYIRVNLSSGYLIVLWLFHVGISCTVLVVSCFVMWVIPYQVNQIFNIQIPEWSFPYVRPR